MAAPVGLEPTTSRLTAVCSAIELWGIVHMGRMGIEPTSLAFQASATTISAISPFLDLCNRREPRDLNPHSSDS